MINTLCVCGAGTMGSGIAQAAIQSGIYTVLYEPNEAVLGKAKAAIETNLQVLADKGKITDKARMNALASIQYRNDAHDLLADVFIEAIVEKIETKISLFNQLAEMNPGESIFATNTSSLPVTKIADAVVNPERVIGMHFFNPPTVMKLVEVVRTRYSNKETTDIIIELAKAMSKTPVLCSDAPGFIVNRVARPYYIESLRLVEENISSLEQVDRLMEASAFKMGPFKLMDLIGNDINYAVSCSVYDQLNKPERLKPSFIQQEKVRQGKLGKKTNEGYYNYQT